MRVSAFICPTCYADGSGKHLAMSATDEDLELPTYHEPEYPGLHVRPFLVACATSLAACLTFVRCAPDPLKLYDQASILIFCMAIQRLWHDPRGSNPLFVLVHAFTQAPSCSR